jgi:DNA-directed RNA polymerase subunit RPC12/RpoP
MDTKEFEPGNQRDDDNIICPHCGYKLRADPCDGDADEGPKDCECGECGKEYISWAEISIDYRTSAKEHI